MNFLKLFNVKFMYQNIKKSRATLILIFLLYIILTSSFIILNSNSVITLTNLSIVALIGMIIPFILSYICFGFVYKRKTVDFVNSMPISRKSIFASNTLLGFVIILALMFLTSLAMPLVSSFVGSVLTFNVIVDYFILWTIVYIFIFSVSNLAMSISGNEITTIIVSFLIILLVPFINDFITAIKYDKTNIKLTISENVVNKIDENYIYLNNIRNNNTTNFVYERFRNLFLGEDFLLYKTNQILLMIFLSFIYIILGCFVFNKKEMEVSETSFKSYNLHSFIKCLTLIPFMFLLSYLLLEDGLSVELIIFSVIIISYYYAYDLITKKGIKNLFQSILFLVIFSLSSFGVIYFVSFTKEKDITYTLDDIDGISIEGDCFNLLKTNNKDLIKVISNNKIEYGSEKVIYYIGNKKIVNHTKLTKNSIEKINKIVKDNNYSDNLITFKSKDSLALTIDNNVYSIKDFPKLNEFSGTENNNHSINFYYYDKINHVIKVYNNYLNDKQINYIYTINNNKNIDKLSKTKDINNYPIIVEVHEKDNINYYGYAYNNRDLLFDYVKNIPKTNIDINNDYIVFTICTDKGYNIIDSNIDAFIKYLYDKNITYEDIFDYIKEEDTMESY